MTDCRSCGALVLWAKTSSGKAMPVDADPVGARGNLVLDTEAGELVVRVVRVGSHDPSWVSHFSSCPNAGTHRQRRTRERS